MPHRSQPAGLVLLNPEAGHAQPLRQPIEAWLARHAPGVVVLAPASVDEAQATLAIMASRSRVVLVGGDGTLHRMLPAILRCGHRIGLVPAGRRNDTARALAIDRLQLHEALAYALHAPTAPIDLGQLDTETETRHFVTAVQAGFDAELARRLPTAPARLSPTGRLLWAGAGAWPTLRRPALRVWVNGQLEHDGPALAVSVFNTGTVHGGVPAAPPARIDDHRFETLVVGDVGRLRALPLLWRLAHGRHVHPPRVSLHSTRKVLVDATAPLALSIDGEALAPVSRFSVHVVPRALHLAGAHMLAEHLTDRHQAGMSRFGEDSGAVASGPTAITQPAALPA
jgi:diacylglycerol kinase family enzyme